MKTLTSIQATLFQTLVTATYETIVEMGVRGAHEGVLYLVWAEHGFDLSTFRRFLERYEQMGLVRCFEHVVYAADHAPLVE